MGFNNYITQQQKMIEKQLVLENDKKIVSTIIDISQGKYDCYGDYYEQHQKEVEEYEKVKEEISNFEGKTLAVIYIPPSPLLSEELFNFIVIRGRYGTNKD